MATATSISTTSFHLLHPTPVRRHLRRLRTSASPNLRVVSELQSLEGSAAPVVGVAEHVRVLKEAAKSRRVPKADVLSALAGIVKAKGEIDPSCFLETLGGTESPGRTWMLIFTAQGSALNKGNYFPITAVQRFDAAAKRIENGVYLGPLGCLTFEGRFSWNKRILAFIFECIKIKIGPFEPLQIDFNKGDDKEPSTKGPFFIWFYVDEEIAVAKGRSGGTAYWCRCRRLT